jgi:hypothetical protein
MIKVFMMTIANCHRGTPFASHIQDRINERLRELEIPDDAVINISIESTSRNSREVSIITKDGKYDSMADEFIDSVP